MAHHPEGQHPADAARLEIRTISPRRRDVDLRTTKGDRTSEGDKRSPERVPSFRSRVGPFTVSGGLTPVLQSSLLAAERFSDHARDGFDARGPLHVRVHDQPRHAWCRRFGGPYTDQTR